MTVADRAYRLIVETMGEGAAMVSPQGVILDANPRLGAMAGRAAAGLAGCHVLNLVVQSARPALARLMDTGGRGEAELSGPGGVTVPVLVSVSTFGFNEMPLRCVIVTDLSEQRRNEARLLALNAELDNRIRQRTAALERADKNLESLAHAVSHDLRAPLRALSGFSDALAEEYGDRLGETGRGYTERIKAASERMAALLDGLLQLSRVSRAALSARPVNLSAEAAAIAGELQAAAPGRPVRVRIQPGLLVMADRDLMRIVVQNLLQNAWKFTAQRQDADIEFGAVAGEGQETCCYVRDNGAGFDPAYAEKLFVPFQRLHDAREYPGSGIGLAVAQRVMEKHGGRIWAESSAGEGATFFFALPGAPGDITTPSQQAARTGPPPPPPG